jgi:hypothetical protein
VGQVSVEPCPKCRENGRDTRGDNLKVYANKHKHCFACGYHYFPPNWWRFDPTGGETNSSNNGEGLGTKSLPADFTREVPAKGWRWLLQYGLGYQYWLPYTGYSPKEDRLILTVGNGPEFSIGRDLSNYDGRMAAETGNSGSALASSSQGEGGGLDGEPGRLGEGLRREERPVLLAQEKPKWKTYGNCHETAHIFGDYLTSKAVILVEDLISAHKVGRVNVCIPLFGTHIHDCVLRVLRHINLPVIIWLDNDQRHNIISKASKLMVYINKPVSYRFSEKDPKELSLDQIKEIING